MVKIYTPSAGDIVVINFNPQAGHEQKGRRPALIVSDHKFNKKTGLAFTCPITNSDNGFLYHVPVEGTKKTGGFIMVEHLKSVDCKARKIQFIECVSASTMRKVRHLLSITI